MKIKNKVLVSVDKSDLKDGHFYNSEITEIGNNCFCNMDSLIAVHVPNVKKIGSYCFRSNPAMTTTGDFGALTAMGDWCFRNNRAMIEDNSIRVRAFDFETRVPVGEYDTCSKAANKLFIKSAESISDYVNLRKRTVNKSGVKSKKTGKVYHFEKIEKTKC